MEKSILAVIIVKRTGYVAPTPYIFLLIVLAFILLFGYRAITLSTERDEEIQVTLLKTQLERDFKQIDFGEVRIGKYDVPANIQTVCFSEPKQTNPLECSPDACPLADEYPVLRDAVGDGSSDNVFFLGEAIVESTRIDDFTVSCCEFICIEVERREIALRLEGAGQDALIEGI